MQLIITTTGLGKIAGATIEAPLILEKFAVGDGGGSEVVLDPTRNSLVNEKYRDLLNNKYSNNNNIVIECVLRANAAIAEGFYLREIGIFDVDGDLIAHANLPEQYRPATSEGNIVTENIFNVNLKVQNTDNIQVFIEETIFATEDSVQRLLERVETIENNSKKLVEASVGIDKWFNTDNKYKDQNMVEIGIKTWALMDSSNILSIADYPILFKNINAVDRGDGTFAMPNFNDGTIRHLPKGTSRTLGSFEEDDVKAHAHTTADHTHSVPAHTHGIADITGTASVGEKSSYASTATGAFLFTGSGYPGRGDSDNDNTLLSFSSHRAGVTATASSGAGNTGSGGSGNTGPTGGTETRMKNTSGQWYMLARVDI